MKPLSELVVIRDKGPSSHEKSERAQVTKDIFELYNSIIDKKLRRVDNWKRYVEWCKTNKVPDSDVNRKLFRRSHRFIKDMPIGTFCFFLSHLSLTDLYYCLSVCKDRNQRGESVSAWIISQCKLKR